MRGEAGECEVIKLVPSSWRFVQQLLINNIVTVWRQMTRRLQEAQETHTHTHNEPQNRIHSNVKQICVHVI